MTVKIDLLKTTISLALWEISSSELCITSLISARLRNLEAIVNKGDEDPKLKEKI